MSWQTWAQAAGVGGFFMGGGSLILGIQNFRHTRGAPAREEQRSERSGLRELLYAAKADLEAAVRDLSDAKDLSLEKPASFDALRDAIPRYKDILESPNAAALDQISRVLTLCKTGWSSVARHVRDAAREQPINNDPQGRQRAATEQRAKETFELALEAIDDSISTINALNRAK